MILSDKWHTCNGGIDRDFLITPDALVDILSTSPKNIAKTLLDSIWNACGYKNCSAFDFNGDYIGLKRW